MADEIREARAKVTALPIQRARAQVEWERTLSPTTLLPYREALTSRLTLVVAGQGGREEVIGLTIDQESTFPYEPRRSRPRKGARRGRRGPRGAATRRARVHPDAPTRATCERDGAASFGGSAGRSVGVRRGHRWGLATASAGGPR
jgi:hypothetical protein